MKTTLWRVKSIKDCFLVKVADFAVPQGTFTIFDEFVSYLAKHISESYKILLFEAAKRHW